MRYFTFFVLISFSALSSYAQSQEKMPQQNTNTTTINTNATTTQPKISVNDSVLTTPELEEVQIQSKKSKTYKEVSRSQSDIEQKNLNLKASSQQLQSAKYQFETNYSNSRHQLYRRSPSAQEFSNMRQSARLYANNLPGSFENHFYHYLLNKYNPQQFPELEKAASLNPNQTEVQQELVVYGIATNNRELSDSVTLQMIKQNKIAEGVMAYAADLVNSVPANSTLLLHGYTELIPANYQVNLQKRTDLKLISVDLMQSPAYQENLSSSGFILPGSTYVDTSFVQEFCSRNTSRNIYLSMSFPKEYFLGISQSLSPVGLTFAYKSTLPDRDAWNMNLVQSIWKKDLLGISRDAQSDALSANYLPTLISIEQLYREYNRSEDAKEMSQLILSVATRAGKTGQLSKIKR